MATPRTRIPYPAVPVSHEPNPPTDSNLARTVKILRSRPGVWHTVAVNRSRHGARRMVWRIQAGEGQWGTAKFVAGMGEQPAGGYTVYAKLVVDS